MHTTVVFFVLSLSAAFGDRTGVKAIPCFSICILIDCI